MQKQKYNPYSLRISSCPSQGSRSRDLAHHKHSEQSDKVTPHKHAHSQFLLYLRGRGIQTTGLNKQPVMRGSFLYFPPQTLHGFIKSMESSPSPSSSISTRKNPLSSETSFKNLPPAVLSEIERTLHRIINSADLEQESLRQIAAQILSLFCRSPRQPPARE